MAERPTHASFAACVNDTFRLVAGETHHAAVLVEAKALGPGARAAREVERFSLVFRTAPEVVLPQRVYRLEHDSLGALDLFLVPIGPDGEGMCYEAVFA